MTTTEYLDLGAGTRGVAFGLAVAACKTLDAEITAERLWSLVEAFMAVLNSIPVISPPQVVKDEC